VIISSPRLVARLVRGASELDVTDDALVALRLPAGRARNRPTAGSTSGQRTRWACGW